MNGYPVTEKHPDYKYPKLRTAAGSSSIHGKFRLQFFDTTVNNVRALALRNGTEEAKMLFDHNLDLYPTMAIGYNHHHTFYHATPMSPWTIFFLDKDYMLVTPKEYGPIRKKKVTKKGKREKGEKEGISGRQYYDGLSPEARKDLDESNYCRCLLPSFMIPPSIHRSTTTHMDDEENARSLHVFVGDSGAGSYYFSLFKPTRNNCYTHDHVHYLIAIPRRNLAGGIAHVGIDSDGCEHLGFTQGIVRITDM